ncbi:hypothetical protein BCR34DRAFT_361496 [Clohesyomyces aquaticus]|uniref:WSC domain-containing protein n=1 Tax=Clohesyomyces aquaticus TaxID=1231657 RepID=A0A1Y2A857_9PLEO|nr:hypothetical protein BCR34DRAFT_361496 [Clohesyomyces aquaticus]
MQTGWTLETVTSIQLDAKVGRSVQARVVSTPEVALWLGLLLLPLPRHDYLGCWTDADQRSLPSNNEASNSMTAEYCQQYCSANCYDLFGTEDGNECWCSGSISTAGRVANVDESECSTACNGNTAEVGGGVGRVNSWQRSPLTIDPFQGYQGCYMDHDDPGRTLGSFFADSSDMTVEKCADICLD